MTEQFKQNFNVTIDQVLRWVVPLGLTLIGFMGRDIYFAVKDNASAIGEVKGNVGSVLQQAQFLEQRITSLEREWDRHEHLDGHSTMIERVRRLEERILRLEEGG